MRRTLVALAMAATLSAPLVGTPQEALAQPQNGLVNVRIGDVTLEDINIGVAAQIVAAACDTVDVNAAVLAVQGVASGGDDYTCSADGGTDNVQVTQN